MAHRKTGKKKDGLFKGVGCVVLFCLPFAGVGVAMAGALLLSLADWVDMRSWEEVPAYIEEAKLETHSDSDGNTYEVRAVYWYRYRGETYTGKRVGIHSKSDNLGSWHDKAYSSLKPYRESGEPFRCFVDPDHPEQSVLFRDLRWERMGFYMLFTLCFGGMGVGFMTVAILGARRYRREQQRMEELPEEPWRWEEEWAEGVIRSSNKVILRFSVGFALFWNLVTAPLWFVIPAELKKGNTPVLVGGVFLLVGLGLVVWAVKNILRMRKYGQSEFRMAPVPGVIGGALSGVVRIPVKVRPEGGFRLVLDCVSKESSGTESRRSGNEKILWQDTRIMKRGLLESDFTQSAIPVLFKIPYILPPSGVRKDPSNIEWRLKVSAHTPGIDYAAIFKVPVFKTADSDPDFELDDSAVSEYMEQPDPEAAVRNTGAIIRTLQSGGKIYHFPMARRKGMAFGTTIFFAIWTGVVIFLYRAEAPLLFPILFGLFDVLLLYLVLDLWFSNRTIKVDHQGLILSGGFFGVGPVRAVGVDEMGEFELKRGMQSGDKLFYNLVLRTRDGKSLTMVKGIEGKEQGDALIDEIRKTMRSY